MSLTKRDFNAIAEPLAREWAAICDAEARAIRMGDRGETLHWRGQRYGMSAAVNAVAVGLALTNRNFDRERFKEACMPTRERA